MIRRYLRALIVEPAVEYLDDRFSSLRSVLVDIERRYADLNQRLSRESYRPFPVFVELEGYYGEIPTRRIGTGTLVWMSPGSKSGVVLRSLVELQEPSVRVSAGFIRNVTIGNKSQMFGEYVGKEAMTCVPCLDDVEVGQHVTVQIEFSSRPHGQGTEA